MLVVKSPSNAWHDPFQCGGGRDPGMHGAAQCAQGVKHRMHVAWDINGKHLHALLHTDLEAPLEHKPIRNAVFLKLPMHQKEHLCRACKDRVDLSLLA